MVYGLILNERCFKFPIQPRCTFNWMFPYGPFTAANQRATQIVVKVGAEHKALGSFWLQDLGNWLRFPTAAGRRFLPDTGVKNKS